MTKTALELLDAAKLRALEFTGHTDDLDAAFDQWQAEREALVEFHALNTRYEKLMKVLRNRWDVIRVVLFGRDDVLLENTAYKENGKNIITAEPINDRTLEKFVEAARGLDIWNDALLKERKRQREATNSFQQLRLNMAVHNDKGSQGQESPDSAERTA